MIDNDRAVHTSFLKREVVHTDDLECGHRVECCALLGSTQHRGIAGLQVEVRVQARGGTRTNSKRGFLKQHVHPAGAAGISVQSLIETLAEHPLLTASFSATESSDIERPRRTRAAHRQILHGSVVVAMQDRAWGAARWALRGGLLACDDGVQLVVVPVKLLEFQVRNSGGEKWRDCVCEGHSSSDRSLVRLAPKAMKSHKILHFQF